MANEEAMLLGGYRTAFSKYGGALKEWSSVNVGSKLLAQALEKMGISGDEVDMLICGTAFPSEIGTHGNINGRQVLLAAGLPPTIMSFTVDLASCTGMLAVSLGYRFIKLGEAKTVVIIGTEALSNAPFLVPPRVRWEKFRGDFNVMDPLFPLRYNEARKTTTIQDVDSEANLFNVSREDMDQWAFESQRRYAAAKEEGWYKGEIVPLKLANGEEFVEDEAPKPWTTMEGLRKLKPVFGSNLVTPGNAPGLETGAAMVVLMSAELAEKKGLNPMASIVGVANVAGDVESPLIQGARATNRVLKSNGKELGDISCIDIEEDFACVVPISANAWEKEWDFPADKIMKRTNIPGGATAYGHPLAAGGVRSVLAVGRQLQGKPNEYGIATVSGGLANGVSVLLKGV